MSHSLVETHKVAKNSVSNLVGEFEEISATPDRHRLGTVFTPVRIDARKLALRGVYFQSPIDLKLLQTHFPPSQVLSADPLIVNVAGNAHVVVLGFGAVVFWQCNGLLCANVLQQIKRVLKIDPPKSDVQDTLLVLVDQPEERVNFKDIWLENLTLEHMRIISETLGQSLALKQCELSVIKALKQTTPMVKAMETRGELIAPAKNILKTVGFTLAVREAILAKLSLFDDPAETWQSERLAQLHNLLHDHFDIKKRLSALHEKLTFLSDLNVTLMNLLQNRTSHRLEWTVILLIVIEVIFSFYHFFSSFHG